MTHIMRRPQSRTQTDLNPKVSISGPNFHNGWLVTAESAGSEQVPICVGRRGLVLGLAAALAAPSTALWAQAAWPSRPVRIVVPFPPGGTTDLLARALTGPLSEAFGQPFTVENRGGAGGNIGAEAVARSAPDGHTLLMGTVGTHGINKALYSRLSFDPQKDFAPVTLVAGVPNVMVMNTRRAQELGINSVADFVRYARAHPGRLNMASSGNGTSIHLAGELFKARNRIFMTHIPYRGSGPALVDLLGGGVDVMFDNLPSAMPHIQAGSLRAFAVTSAQPSASLPQVPTVAQAAGLPGFEASSWFGLLAPAGTPSELVSRLQQAVAQALAEPAMMQRLLALGAEPSGNTPVEFARLIESELAKWASVVKASGARVD